jgi:pimeloyl-ACP methyl ester carboxylesterase
VITSKGLGWHGLADGRRLDTWVGGDAEGPTVVYFHGTPAGRLQAALGDGAARRAGVRLVAFSRPGYGASSDAATTLTSVARDALELADLLGADSFATLGASGGGPYALATAALAPDRVCAVGVVAGVGPLAQLDPRVTHDPAVRLALAGDVAAAVALNDELFGPPPDTSPGASDAEVVDRFSAMAPEAERSAFPPEMLEPWASDLRDAVPTFRGASRDSLAFAAGWDFELSSVQAPVWLWYGERDQLVPLEHGWWLRDRLARPTFVLREGAGHLATLMPHWTEILTTLRLATA